MKRLLLLILITILLAACGNEDKPEIKDEAVEEENQIEESKESGETEVTESEGSEEVEQEEPDTDQDATWDDIKELDKIVGKSDKDFPEVTNAKPSEVRNDATGNWRITKVSESIPIEEYALSYYNTYMKDDEVHFIVNFNYNTTTWLNMLGGLLYVEVREYVSREEHDAKKLGNGMVLKSYVIYPDGDIQELEI